MVENIQIAKISASSIVIYNKQLDVSTRSERQIENEENLRDKEYNGFMSPKTRCKVRKMLDAWITSIELRRDELMQGAYYRNSKISFVTLTLSGKQKHDDNFIKRNMLNRFIVEMRREQGIHHYFWRAEPQKNGNIHFHILIDKYVHYKVIRDKWNKIQGDNGYLTEFYNKFMHLDPNSTDVHGLNKIKSLAAYVVKYCCKSGTGRAIGGRIWGASDSLRKLTCYESELTCEVNNYIEAVQNDAKARVVKKEEFTLIFCDNKELLKRYSPSLYQKFHSHYSEVFNDLYTEEGRQKVQREIEREKICATFRAAETAAHGVDSSRPLGCSQLQLFFALTHSAFV